MEGANLHEIAHLKLLQIYFNQIRNYILGGIIFT